AGAADEFAFAQAGRVAVVAEQVEHSLQMLSAEQGIDGFLQVDFSLRQDSMRKGGGMEMACQSRFAPDRSNKGRQDAGLPSGRHADHERRRAAVGPLAGKS